MGRAKNSGKASTQRARLLATAGRVRDLTERLLSVSGELNRAGSPAAVAAAAVGEGGAAVRAKYGALWLTSTSGTQLEQVRADGPGNQPRYACIPLLREIPVALAVLDRQPVWVESREEYAKRFPAYAALSDNVADFPMLALACLPLLVDDRAVGALAFAFDDARRFGEEERSFLMVLARHCAQAVERAHLAAAHQEASATREAVIQASPAAIMLLDLDSTVQMWSSAAERIFGWKAAEVVGRLLPAVSELERPELERHLQRIAEGQTLEGVETQRRRADGSLFDVQLWAAPVRRADGHIQCLSVVTDITARRRLDRAQAFLAQAGALLSSSLDYGETLQRVAALSVPTVGDWCFVDLVQADGGLDRVGIGHADPAMAEVARRMRRRLAARPEVQLGVSAAVADGRAQLRRDVDDGVLQQLARDPDHLDALRAMKVRSYMCAPLLVGSRVLGAITFGSCARNYDDTDLALANEIARRAAVVIENARLYELAEKARAEASRAAERAAFLAELSAALATSLDTATTINTVGRMVVPGVADWCRLDLMEEGGAIRHAASFHGDADRLARSIELVDRYRSGPEQVGGVAWVIATGQALLISQVTEEMVARQPRPDEYARFLLELGMRSFLAVPLVARGRTLGCLVLVQSESGRRFDEADLALAEEVGRRAALAIDNTRVYAEAEVARRQAEAASRMKDEFLAMLGHELRNPLAPILTALELLRLRGSHEGERERTVIERQVQHLVRLVDDLLDISRITRGKIELRRNPVEVSSVVAKALEMVSALLEQRAIRLAVDVPTGLVVDGDPVRLAQVFANLLTNAAKYTEPGGAVTIAAAGEGPEVAVHVRDDGMGIAPELLPRVFDLFVQGARALDRSQGGLGLGLSIVRNLVVLHGGSIAVYSEGAGRGSDFVVRLPLAPEEKAHATGKHALVTPPAPESSRVLIVDDNVDAAEMLAELLGDLGCATRMAHDGPAALSVAGEFKPDLAILDIGLPVMDGYELAERLRSTPGLESIHLVAVTGYGLEADRRRAQAAGFDEHLVKPVDLDRVVALIERWCVPAADSARVD